MQRTGRQSLLKPWYDVNDICIGEWVDDPRCSRGWLVQDTCSRAQKPGQRRRCKQQIPTWIIKEGKKFSNTILSTRYFCFSRHSLITEKPTLLTCIPSASASLGFRYSVRSYLGFSPTSSKDNWLIHSFFRNIPGIYLTMDSCLYIYHLYLVSDLESNQEIRYPL